jgi:hypothetical protein
MDQPPETPSQPASPPPVEPSSMPPQPAPAAWAQPAPPSPVPPQAAASAWAQPAPAPPGWVMPAAQAGPVRVIARIGGLFLALIAIFWGLIGLAFVVGAAVVKNYLDVSTLPGYGDLAGGALVTIGVIVLFFSIVELLTGIGAMFGKSWARALGLLYALVFGAFSLLFILQSNRITDITAGSAGSAGSAGVVLFFGAHLRLYAYVLIVFLFGWRGRSAA